LTKPADGKVLEIRDLRTYFFTEAGVVKAIDGISLHVEQGETLGLVGESGSGKTVTALSTLKIVPKPGRIVGGTIRFEGKDILSLSEKQLRELRGNKIAIVFQDPSSSLNPVYTIGHQLSEIIQTHQKLSKKAAIDKSVKLLEEVAIADAETRIHDYPDQLSGGMRQRVALARALACEPTLLFADEPTTNLDVTIQAQILELMKSLKQRLGMSMVMITHDMGIVADMADRITVIYAGQVCETAKTIELFENPLHPYTESLLEAVPRLDMKKPLESIPGNVPNLIEPPSGCRFHPRCKYATEICKHEVPPFTEVKNSHFVACHHWKELE